MTYGEWDGFKQSEGNSSYYYTPPPNEGWTTIPIVTFEELQKINPDKKPQ